MPPEERARSERADTDESLRVERERADLAFDESVIAVDQTADAVISRARARADEVLAKARAATDRQSIAAATRPTNPEGVQKDRRREDQVLLNERAAADKAVREERAEHVALLAHERNETDKDLSNERARSDDSLATRDEVLGIVSHDLRSLLNAIVGNAALIAQGVSREDHADQVLVSARRIQRAGARMDRLIGDLVDVATIDGGVLAVTREIADVSTVVAEAVDTFQTQAAASGISLVYEVAPLPPVSFDPARLLQVLTNLLSNAIRFTPANGRIVVRVELNDDELRFTVTDTGVGIPSDKLEAVFERFLQVTRKDQRSVGLGLYISRCIVQGHGGRIWAENRAGGGSSFCFTIPVAPQVRKE